MPRLKVGRGRKRDFPPKKSRCSKKLGIRFRVSGFPLKRAYSTSTGYPTFSYIHYPAFLYIHYPAFSDIRYPTECQASHGRRKGPDYWPSDASLSVHWPKDLTVPTYALLRTPVLYEYKYTYTYLL